MTNPQVTRLLGALKDYLTDRRGELIKIVHRKDTLAKLDGHEIRTNTAKMRALGEEGLRIDELIQAIETEEKSFHSTDDAMALVFKSPADLLKRLDGLERFTPDQEAEWPAHPMKRNRNGNWVRFEQVKTIIGQWIADRGEK